MERLIPAKERLALLGLMAVAVALAGLCALSAWKTSGGRFMFPLDDSYIHLQYARQLAHGAPFVYAPEGSPSGGASSPAWVLLTAPIFLLGLDGTAAAGAAYAICVLIWAITPLVVWHLTRRLACRSAAWGAAVLVLLNGHLLWNSTNGMETGLFGLLIIGAALGWTSWWKNGSAAGRALLLASLALLPVTRPEGILVVLLAACLAWYSSTPERRLSPFLVLLCAVPFVAWLAALWATTGEWKPAGLIAKGLLDRTDVGLMTKARVVADTLFAIPTRFYNNIVPHDGYALFKGTDYLPYVPTALGVTALFGGIIAAIRERGESQAPLALFLVLVWLLGLASLAASSLPWIHQQRYLAPWTLPAIVLAMVGLSRLSESIRPGRDGVVLAGAITFAVLSLPSVPFWIVEYGRNSSDIYRQHRTMTFALNESPAGEGIAVTDTGVLTYYTQRPTEDLVGLTTARFTRTWQAGEGAVVEELAAGAARPRTLITYRDWFTPLFPADWAAPEAQTPLSETSITGGLNLARYRIDWARLERAAMPLVEGATPVAEVNVAHLGSESRAAYRWQIDRDDERPDVMVKYLTPTGIGQRDGAVEGGRFVRRERFIWEIPAFAASGTAPVLVVRAATNPLMSPRADARVLRARFEREGAPPVSLDIPLVPADPGVFTDTRIQVPALRGLPAGSWQVTIEASEDAGAAWLSFRHALVLPSGS